MNSEADASHVRKQSFHEDEYRAFRIALDVKETEIGEFWNNIDELKSKKEFLRIREELENKIVKKKKPGQESRSNYVEKGAKDTKTKTKGRTLSSSTRGGENENICGSADMKENAPPTSEKDSKLKGGSTGAIKKKTNERKTKKTDRRHASVTDATNTIHSGSDDVMKEGKKSKDARVLAKKENLRNSRETGKVGEETSKKKGKKEVKKSEIDGDENQKSKAKWQVQFKKKKHPTKQKENLQIEEVSSNPAIEGKDLGKEKKNAKKKTVSSLNQEYIEKKGDVIKRPRQRKEKTKSVAEVDGKDIEEKKAKNEKKHPIKQKENLQIEEVSSNPGIEGKDFGQEKKNAKKKTVSSLNEECIEKKGDVIKRPRQRKEKTKSVAEVDGKDIEEKKAKLKKKKVHFKDGGEEISKAEIEGKNDGNQETMIKKSKNKRNKAVEDEDIEKVDDQKKETLSKKSRNSKTVKSTEPKTKKKVLNEKDKKLVNQDKDKVNKKHDDKIEIEDKNINSDHDLMKSNAPNTHSGGPEEINYHSENLNTVPWNMVSKQKDLSSEKQLECTEYKKRLESIDQSIFQKSNAAQVSKNNECDFRDKNFEKPSLTVVIKNTCLFEKKVNNSENSKSVEDPKKSSDCAMDGENKSEKPEKTKTSYEFKQEVMRRLDEIHHERQMAKAVEKLSKDALKHVKKFELDSNPALKQYLNLESYSDSDSNYTTSDSSDFYSSECSCSCSSVCSCSCCSDCRSSYDSESSSSCSCSNCSSSDRNSSDSGDSIDTNDFDSDYRI